MAVGMLICTYVHVSAHTHRATLYLLGETLGRDCLSCRIEKDV